MSKVIKNIAIIGSGISGLIVANELASYANVTVFEKSRGVSGRMSTRYADPYQFDHGAQFFTAKTQEFKNFLKPLIELGVVGRWDARFVELDRSNVLLQRQWGDSHPHYIGTPRMNQIAKHLAKEINVRLGTRITNVEKESEFWCLRDESGNIQGKFDWVVSTAPAPQSADILPNIFTHHNILQNTRMLSCFALMLGFSKNLMLPWDAALVTNADISWVSVNSSKIGRPESCSLLINSTNSWADKHIDDNHEDVKEHLCKEVSEVIGRDVTDNNHISLHGWRYANIGKQNTDKSLIDEENNLAACGDWCVQGRVESAFISAMNLSKRMKELL